MKTLILIICTALITLNSCKKEQLSLNYLPYSVCGATNPYSSIVTVNDTLYLHGPSFYHQDSFEFDINNNGSPNFKIYTSFTGSPGSGLVHQIGLTTSVLTTEIKFHSESTDLIEFDDSVPNNNNDYRKITVNYDPTVSYPTPNTIYPVNYITPTAHNSKETISSNGQALDPNYTNNNLTRLAV